MPTQTFYHSADLDGMCAGAIVKQAFPDCQMTGINYGQAFPFEAIEKEPGQEIYMVDFTLQPFEDMERLNRLCKLIWIDHHKTAIDEALKRGFLASGGQLIEVGQAACELTWKWFFPDKIAPYAVHHLGRYDVWDHSEEDTLPFQWGMRQFEDTRPDNVGLWADLLKEMSALAIPIKNDGRLLRQYERSQNLKFCKAYAFETQLRVPLPGYPAEQAYGHHVYNAICCNRGFTSSQLFDSVWDAEKYDLMITFCRLKPPAYMWTVSLYSTKDNIDCGIIAKSFGGGGHKGAAGFQSEYLPFNY